VPAELQDVAGVAGDQLLGGELADPADREPVEQDEPAGGPGFEGKRGVVEAAPQLFPALPAARGLVPPPATSELPPATCADPRALILPFPQVTPLNAASRNRGTHPQPSPREA
jgi:hypothetical protein